MTATIIIALCVLLLIAYLFDLSSRHTRIPSVILLLLLGWMMQQFIADTDISIPDLQQFLPGFGTVGLILIVLEGALELKLNRSKIPIIKKSFIVALLPIFLLSFAGSAFLFYVQGLPFTTGLINAIPLSIISSAIAIPTVSQQPLPVREFVTYESSFSDIIGILFFNFILTNSSFGFSSFSHFIFELFLMIVISLLATVFLAYILSRLNHHVKYLPMVIMVILIYEIAKVYHLPSLLFILIFGLFLENVNEWKHFRLIQMLKPSHLEIEVGKLRELVREAAFFIRALFFILFGFLMKTTEMMNPDTILAAIAITALIFVLRALLLFMFKLPINNLLHIAPRGLITILLFVSIPASSAIESMNKSLIIQVIVLTALLMMAGQIFQKKAHTHQSEEAH